MEHPLTSYDVQIPKSKFLLFLEAFLYGTILLQIDVKTLSRQKWSRRTRRKSGPSQSRVTCQNCPISNFVGRVTCGVAKARC